MNLREAAQQATPREQLLKELMDSRVPKTEREHAAAREIGDLRAALAEDRDAEPGNTLDHIAGANKMVDQSEDALGMVATSQESRQVEPVGYFSINDYGNWEQNESNSGTPLYDAPPKHDPLTDVQQEMGATISKTETVEPVAWMWDYRQLDGHVITKVIFAKHYKHSPGDLAYVLEGKDAKPLYTAPPNREPLTDEEIKDLWDEQNFYLTDWHSVIDFVRDIERAHGIGGEE